MNNSNVSQTKNTHFDFVDLLKGFGIFLVVWGHTMTPRSIYIYSFHMPLFFFLSGFVHKDKPFRQFVLSKINALYIPYLTFSALSWMFYLVQMLLDRRLESVSTHLPKLQSLLTGSADNGGNNPIWFLTCILVVSIIFLVLDRYLKHPAVQCGVILGLSLIGYRLSLARFDLLFQSDIALSGLVFYWLGYSIKKCNFLQHLNDVKRRKLVWVIVACEIIHIATAYLNTRLAEIQRVNMAGNLLGNYFLFYISALTGIAVFLIIGYKLQYIHVFNHLGMNTLIILATHKPLLQVFNNLLDGYVNTDTRLYGFLSSILAIALSLLLGIYLNKKFPYIIGKKPFYQLFHKTTPPISH
ncbi:fucose 4-O-acetylase-like acetyltransferase [Hydrogenispora ethanolica]|uniref:Fucose 4-O-acetylase-like acetyltransferase n=1 Tax=Hydrogenispora ethanolica TaxID=1082276 RepID=A0A4R1R4F0_HYDET|nr:acyltransferase family protein [Hydrogenispora ethanolica]TCL60298.1 fucose 4-O-acetylase-like acetyltransferase [Hydrogenispora ethanolica]